MGLNDEVRCAGHQRYPLVAALVRPGSPITPKDLLPSLLTAEAPELQATLWLFAPEQLGELLAEAHTLITSLDDIQLRQQVEIRVTLMECFLSEYNN